MSQLTLPTSTGKNRLWLDPVVEEVVRIMHEGDPTIGWEGDPRLGLYITEGGEWEVVRFAEDGKQYLILRSKPGVNIAELPLVLAQGDSRRRNARSLEEIFAEGDRRQLYAQEQLDGEAAQALEQVYFEANKAGAE